MHDEWSSLIDFDVFDCCVEPPANVAPVTGFG